MKFKVTTVLIFLSFILFGCGINVDEKKDCIQKVDFESTKSVKIHLVKVVDKNFSFSDLEIKDDEKFVCLSTPNILSCDNSYGKLKVTEMPTGTVLRLTGLAKRIEPFGFETAFKNDMIYLQGDVNGTTVWIPLFELRLFAEYGNESALNSESCKTLGIGNSKIVNTLKCFD